jgi:hypothetical protein
MRRFAALTATMLALASLAAGAALGDVPSASASTVPPMLTVVGHDAYGAPDPAGAFTIVVRKLSGNPMYGADVVLDFSGCPDAAICLDPLDPGVDNLCQYHALRRFTDISGTVTFHVIGCDRDPPGATGATLRVYADGVLLRTVPVAVFDLTGCGGVDGGDLSAWLSDYFSGQPFARSDYDGDGILTGSDLSAWLDDFFSANSALGCGAASLCP